MRAVPPHSPFQDGIAARSSGVFLGSVTSHHLLYASEVGRRVETFEQAGIIEAHMASNHLASGAEERPNLPRIPQKGYPCHTPPFGPSSIMRLRHSPPAISPAHLGRPKAEFRMEISSCMCLNCGPSFDVQSRFRETPAARRSRRTSSRSRRRTPAPLSRIERPCHSTLHR